MTNFEYNVYPKYTYAIYYFSIIVGQFIAKCPLAWYFSFYYKFYLHMSTTPTVRRSN